MEALTRLKRFVGTAPELVSGSLSALWGRSAIRLRRSRFAYLFGEGGFNTMDVTAALAITATLAAVVIPSVKGSMDNARVSSLMQEITNLRNGLLKFNSDTNQMPMIVSTSDVTDINGNRLSSSGLRVNDKPIITWQGPYMDKDVGKNPFGGDYALEYDTFVPIDVQVVKPDGTKTASTKNSAIVLVSGLSPGVSDKVDSALDDGVSNTGIIQILSTTVSGVTTEKLVVVILPAVEIDKTTGTVK